MEEEKPDAKLRQFGTPKPESPLKPININPSESTIEKPQELPPAATPESDYAEGFEDGKAGRAVRSPCSFEYKKGYEAGKAEREGKA